MAEATWGDATAPDIDWTMSASLENVTRGGEEVPEVTNLQMAVRAWQQLDGAMRETAVLTLERPVRIDGNMPLDSFTGSAIGTLVERLPD